MDDLLDPGSLDEEDFSLKCECVSYALYRQYSSADPEWDELRIEFLDGSKSKVRLALLKNDVCNKAIALSGAVVEARGPLTERKGPKFRLEISQSSATTCFSTQIKRVSTLVEGDIDIQILALDEVHSKANQWLEILKTLTTIDIELDEWPIPVNKVTNFWGDSPSNLKQKSMSGAKSSGRKRKKSRYGFEPKANLGTEHRSPKLPNTGSKGMQTSLSFNSVSKRSRAQLMAATAAGSGRLATTRTGPKSTKRTPMLALKIMNRDQRSNSKPSDKGGSLFDKLQCKTPPLNRSSQHARSAPPRFPSTPTRPSYFQKSLSNSFPEQHERTGFNNVGNSCYMNAVLQALLSLPLFVQDLVFERSKLPIKRLSFYDGMVKIVEQKKEQGHGVISIRALKDAIGSKFSRFAGYAQQDAHEFFSECLNHLNDDIIEGLKSSVARKEQKQKEKRKEQQQQNVKEQQHEQTPCYMLDPNKFDEYDLAALAEAGEALEEGVEIGEGDGENRNDEDEHKNDKDEHKNEVENKENENPNEEEAHKAQEEIYQKALAHSAVYRNFFTEVEYTMECTSAKCGYKRTLRESFYDFSLDLPEKRAPAKKDASNDRLYIAELDGPRPSSSEQKQAIRNRKPIPPCKIHNQNPVKKMSKKVSSKGREYFTCPVSWCNEIFKWVDQWEGTATPWKVGIRQNKSQAKDSGKTNNWNSVKKDLSSTGRVSEESCSKRTSVVSMIRNFFSRRTIECKCSKCDNDMVYQTPLIRKLPRVLALHIKRFLPNFESQTYEKRMDEVQIERKLDLNFCYNAEDAKDTPESARMADSSDVISLLDEDNLAVVDERLDGPVARKLQAEFESGDEQLQRILELSQREAAQNGVVGSLNVGEWSCSTCTFLNQAEHDRCTMCNEKRENITQAMHGGEKKGEEEQWACSQCTLLNARVHLKCQICGAQKKVKQAPAIKRSPLQAIERSPLQAKKVPQASAVSAASGKTSSKAAYTLQSIVKHKGEVYYSGHYITDIHQKGTSWKRFDDQYSSVVDDDQARQSKRARVQAYIVFYVMDDGG